MKYLKGVLNTLLLVCAPVAFASDAGSARSALPRATPAAVGLSAGRLERMADHFRAEVAKRSAAGYVLIVARYGKVAYSSAVGMRDRERQLPMTLDTRFRLASMTKPITSVAVLMLYEEGRFQLDDPVSRFLPEFADMRVFTGVDANGNLTGEPVKRPITIRHLLTHTSGLGYGPAYDPPSALTKAYAALKLGAPGSLADKVREIASLPLYAHPGEEWRYSFADDVLGRLVEVVSGMPFDRFLTARLFDPLGLRAIGFVVPDVDAGLLAAVYKHNPAGDLERSDLELFQAPTDPARWPSGGAGLVSTAGDYLRFAQMLANGGSLDGREYLSPVTVALMTANHVPDDALFKYWGANSRGLGYGLGVGVEIDANGAPQAGCTGDYSWGGFLDTHWVVSPRTGIVGVLLTQIDPRGNTTPQRTDVDFRNLLFAAVTRLDPTAACLAR